MSSTPSPALRGRLLTWQWASRSPESHADPVAAAPAGGADAQQTKGRGSWEACTAIRPGATWSISGARSTAVSGMTRPGATCACHTDAHACAKVTWGTAHQLCGRQRLAICEQRDVRAPQQHLERRRARGTYTCECGCVDVATPVSTASSSGWGGSAACPAATRTLRTLRPPQLPRVAAPAPTT